MDKDRYQSKILIIKDDFVIFLIYLNNKIPSQARHQTTANQIHKIPPKNRNCISFDHFSINKFGFVRIVLTKNKSDYFKSFVSPKIT